MGIVVEISRLTASDRADWEVLVRGFWTLYEREVSDDGYERTWRRLLDGEEIRGFVARLDSKVVGFAHYLFHTSVWSAGSCYLQDLFVDEENRGRGVARALIERVARDAEEQGAALFYWHTPQDNATARGLYDKVASFRGYIVYSRRPNASQSPAPRT
jgi:ribosomal protein S18 acetylase RimI-like enzyme